MNLVMKDIQVAAGDGSDESVPAKLAECDCGGGAGFVVFQVEGQGHLHLQCIGCGTSYCPGAICKGTGCPEDSASSAT